MKNFVTRNILHITVIFITAIFSACVTMQTDILVESQNVTQTELNLSEVENAVVPLEAAGGNEARNRLQSELTAARRMITAKEREASADADYSGQLTAWSGRLAIIEGRYSDASRLHRQSTTASPGNLPAVILGIRLEGDPQRRLGMIDTELAAAGRASGTGELNIERGRTLIDLNRFSEAAGAFDTAFSSGISSVYQESYGTVRTHAWDLRNTAGVNTAIIGTLSRETMTWTDAVSIAKNETQLFRFITGGRNLSDTELFNRLLERAFIPYTQDVSINEWPRTAPRADEAVTRSGAAWFIWHLYAETRADRGLLSRYSARYATGANPRSPLNDIPALSPFFDSILGCVETELMSLPDGRNFRPALPMRGAELLTILKRIDN